jgi:Fe-S-cluster-containing dehydrogenase component/DMSO reductase anchor subunit
MSTVTDARMPAEEYEPTPIDLFLGRQQSLTAVERFAARHTDEPGATRTGRWRDRLPATAPAEGQQYAFDVDLDACTGCKACVTACHSLNGLDDGEAWRQVGSLHATTALAHGAGVHTVTSSCHHCIDPACLTGCPANAYEKDPITGIVAHLDDECIGCSYCTLTCPYEVPAYNPTLGIVRKCDMCRGRLAEGEAPACVQGCPQGAITIGLVTVADLVAESVDDPNLTLVPGAPASDVTVPTTRYHSARPLDAALVAADAQSVHPAHEHTPLAIMLVLTQAAVGMLLVAAVLRWTRDLDLATSASLSMLVLVTGLLALGASVFHLGRPLLAWRALLGLRHSWLSREILAFGCFAAAAVADAALMLTDAPRTITDVSLVIAVIAGLAGVACSAQLYAATRRTWWRWATTGPRFAATMGVGGGLGVAGVLAVTTGDTTTAPITLLVTVAMAAAATGLVVPFVPLRTRIRRTRRPDDLAGTAHLLGGRLRSTLELRASCALGATVVLPLVALDQLSARPVVAGAIFVGAWTVSLVAEFLDRRLFFVASVAPRMPGSPR